MFKIRSYHFKEFVMIKRALRNWLKEDAKPQWVPVQKGNGKEVKAAQAYEAHKFLNMVKGRLEEQDRKFKDLRADFDLMRPKAVKMELYDKQLKLLKEALEKLTAVVEEHDRKMKWWWQR